MPPSARHHQVARETQRRTTLTYFGFVDRDVHHQLVHLIDVKRINERQIQSVEIALIDDTLLDHVPRQVRVIFGLEPRFQLLHKFRC